MRILLEYLKLRWKTALYILIFCVVQAVIYTLYNLPSAAVWYAGAICLFIGVILVIPDFLFFRRRHITLTRLVGDISLTADNLPAGSNLIENDLNTLIETISADKKLISDEMNGRNKEMSEYYSMWAHQIKTPIAAMKLSLQSEDSQLSRELSEELQRIEQYVDMVMCYVRLDSPSGDFVIRRYQLDDIIRQSVKKFSRQFIRKKIRLIYEPVSCEVLTDEKWLSFVVEQIVSNALKYTKSGSIEITLEEPKTLCIRDTGIGIAAEDLPRIFEQGYTGCNGRADKKASGIGLYLCKRICKRLKHGISAESEIGGGTTIRLHLEETEIGIE